MTLVHSWKNPSEFVRWLSRKRLVTEFSKLNGFQLSSTSTGFLVNSLDLLSFTGFLELQPRFGCGAPWVYLEVDHHPWALNINLPSFTGFSEPRTRSTWFLIQKHS